MLVAVGADRHNGRVLRIDDAQRRARLGVRHALATPTDSPVDAARAVVALHGTDPATTVLSAALRSTGSVDDVLAALYDDRTLVRVLAMRRTVFAVPTDLVTTLLVAASDTVAREQRRLLHKYLVESGITDDPEPWVLEAERVAVDAAEQVETISTAELVAADPLLATRLTLGTGAAAATPTVASRMMTLLGAEGRLVRGRPNGGWTSTQFRWAVLDRWCGDLGPWPALDDAAAHLAAAWFRAYGPATEDDLAWWCGWTKGRTRTALAALDLVEVELDGDGPVGLVLADDVDPVPEPEPWVALLPALDPTVMGWKHRAWHLGPHRSEVFDVNGNAGPTVWVDGRVVGGWTKPDGGPVAMELLEDVGTETRTMLDEKAAALDAIVGDVDLKARARGWSPIEKRLRG